MNGWIYLFYLREFLQQNLPIYKIGQTTDITARIKQYPKGTIIVYACYNDDVVTTENKIIKNFCVNFEQCIGLGREYFRGDLREMVSMIHTLTQLKQKYVIKPIIKCKFRNKSKNNAAKTIQTHWRRYINNKHDAAKIIQIFWRRYIKNKLDAVKIIQVYWRKYRQTKNYNMIKNFVMEEISHQHGKFLDVKSVLYLWNIRFFDKKIKLADVISKFQSHLGTIHIQGSKTGWYNKEFRDKRKSVPSQKKDIWKTFIDNYVVKDLDNFLLWKEIKKPFRIWVKNEFGVDVKINIAKKYLIEKIGPWIHTTTNTNKNKDGFRGWKLRDNIDEI